MQPILPTRKTIRLPGYDYSKDGAYFVTICIHQRRCLLGKIVQDCMRLNEAGKMVQFFWNNISTHYAGISLDAFQIMPNHLHGILFFNKAEFSLSTVINRFKTITTRQYIHNVYQNNWPVFDGNLSQRNYYEHIIRHEEALDLAREYTINNPKNWTKDKMYLTEI